MKHGKTPTSLKNNIKNVNHILNLLREILIQKNKLLLLYTFMK